MIAFIFANIMGWVMVLTCAFLAIGLTKLCITEWSDTLPATRVFYFILIIWMIMCAWLGAIILRNVWETF